MADVVSLVGWNQGVAVAMAAAVWLLCRTRFLGRRPAVCHGLWLLVLLKFVTPPIVPVPVLPAVDAGEHTNAEFPSGAAASAGAACNCCAVKANSSQAVARSSVGAIGQCCLETAAVENSGVPTRAGQRASVGIVVAELEDCACLSRPAGNGDSRSLVGFQGCCSVPGDAGTDDWGAYSRPQGGFGGVVRKLTAPPRRVVVGFSLFVSCVFWIVAACRHFYVQRVLRGGAVESERGTELLRQVARTFDVQAAVRLQVVDAPVTPMLWAMPGKPVILVPRPLMDSLSDDALRGIIAHELGHYTRRDHWANVFAFFVTTLFWWNPLAWFARRQFAEAAEACCDAMALERLPGSRRTYAETLLAVVDSLPHVASGRSVFGIPFGESRSLRSRFEMIADASVKARMTPCGWMVLAGGFAVLMFIPARAQDDAAATTVRPVGRQPAVQAAALPGVSEQVEFPPAFGCAS